VSAYDSFRDVLDAPDADEWIDWLRRRPLVARGEIGRQRFAMLHASVDPDWTLDALEAAGRGVERQLQAPLAKLRAFLGGSPEPRDDVLGRLTRGRSADGRGSWSSDEPAESGMPAWHALWSQRGHDYGVVYGHWAMQGLHVAPGLRGLDTGCVHHGRGHDGVLTAWLPDPDAERPFDVPDERFWSIPARRAYYKHRDA
jgi:bis(5'-nucleosyl)-tetraphosphatase (symmetrical)